MRGCKYLFLFLIVGCAACKHDKVKPEVKNCVYYTIGEIPNLKNNLIYSAEDTRMDSVMTYQSPETPKFSENFSRVTDSLYTNGYLDNRIDTIVNRCYCEWENDTMVLTFYSRSWDRITVLLHYDRFEFYTTRTTDFGGWQKDYNDTRLRDILVTSIHQSLQLDKSPSFTSKQQLTGCLTYTTQDYYANEENLYSKGKIPANCVKRRFTYFQKGKIYFTCNAHYTKGLIERIKEDFDYYNRNF